MYGQALQGRPGSADLLDGIVDGWPAPIGALLDLLATGDRAACDAAMEQYIRIGEAYLATQPDISTAG